VKEVIYYMLGSNCKSTYWTLKPIALQQWL